tara:strand:- start:248 stop:409 length:162 start_codon:yes stop_codon:yes gene_type:complete
MDRLTFAQRNKLKTEMYSGVSEARKREIISLLEQDEERSFLLDLRSDREDEDL